MRVNDGVFTNETFMDTLESAAGIDVNAPYQVP